jgi:glycerophosphoryl diester phosphodiesterase
MLNIAHRGARSLAPENTLAAAQKGLDVGADLWELDVALTADGAPILIHDDTLERTSNVREIFPDRRPWRVHEFSLAEVRQLDFGSWFGVEDPFGQIAAGHISPADLDSYRGAAAPTLRAALEFSRQHHWPVNVELKDLSGRPGEATLVEQVVALVEELGMVEQVIISSFNHAYLPQVKAIHPALATGALVYEPVSDPARLLGRLRAQAFHPHHSIVTPEMIRSLRGQGFEVNVYTVNEEATMKSLIEAGVSGIFTDFPQLLNSVWSAYARGG